MTPEQLAARVYLSVSLIRKVEAKAPGSHRENSAKACDDALGCDGALDGAVRAAGTRVPGAVLPPCGSAGGPDIRSRSTQPCARSSTLVIPGLLQTEGLRAGDPAHPASGDTEERGGENWSPGQAQAAGDPAPGQASDLVVGDHR